jgi:hypothetical protein
VCSTVDSAIYVANTFLPQSEDGSLARRNIIEIGRLDDGIWDVWVPAFDFSVPNRFWLTDSLWQGPVVMRGVVYLPL